MERQKKPQPDVGKIVTRRVFVERMRRDVTDWGFERRRARGGISSGSSAAGAV